MFHIVDEEITKEVLPTLTDEDLKNLGFTLGARKKVSLAIKEMNPNANVSLARYQVMLVLNRLVHRRLNSQPAEV